MTAGWWLGAADGWWLFIRNLEIKLLLIGVVMGGGEGSASYIPKRSIKREIRKANTYFPFSQTTRRWLLVTTDRKTLTDKKTRLGWIKSCGEGEDWDSALIEVVLNTHWQTSFIRCSLTAVGPERGVDLGCGGGEETGFKIESLYTAAPMLGQHRQKDIQCRERAV